jgi:hypothetical protein
MSNEATISLADVSRASSSCKNLTEFLLAEQDFELIGENDSWILRCKLYFSYLSNPFASASLPRKPTGNCLTTRLVHCVTLQDAHCRTTSSQCRSWWFWPLSDVVFSQVACHSVDSELRKFLFAELPGTGLQSHFYCTANKSTNHRITNQVTMICSVVNGTRKGIPLGMESIYIYLEFMISLFCWCKVK